MSNNINRTRKNRFKGKNILVAAALTAALIAGNNVPIVTEQVSAAESQENSVASLIPDNVTIDQPVELADVGLPATEYGTFEWADGSFVPTQRVQSCEVLLIPAEGQDLSHADGWDPESGTVIGYINVVVNSITDNNTEKTDNSGKENSDKPENVDITETPDKTDDTDKKSEMTETPSEKPDAGEKPDADNKEDKDDQAGDGADANNKDDGTDNKTDDKADSKDKTDKDTETVGKLETADDVTQNTEDTKKDDEDDDTVDNIFDDPVLPDNKDDRPTDAEDSLSDEEKEERAEINHTCNGITVSGVNLPWYVQFRVSSGDSYKFTNESDAMIFQSYEFELWDLQNNTEYEIPNGDYISVTVPVKSGYQYTIEHLLDNGATETIIPSVENDIMVFSTHSFSPFGIAGSRQLVGPDTGDDADNTEAVTPTPVSLDSQSSDSEKSNAVSMNDNSDGNNASSSSTQDGGSAEDKVVKNNNAVNTGDTTPIMPFVILFVAAALITGAVIFIKKRKK